MDNRKELFMTKTVVVWFGAMICCFLWGSAYPCIKIGYRMLGIGADAVADQILFAGVRFTLAGILVVLFGSIGSRRLLFPKRENWGRVFRLCLLQTVGQYILFYVGLAHTTGVKASIIDGLSVFAAVLLAALVFHQEKLTAQKIAGCVVGFAGVALINLTGSGIDMNMSFLGEGFIFLSALAYAGSSVYIKQCAGKENPVTLSGWQFFMGGIILTLGGLVAGGRLGGFDVPALLMLFYMACISAVAYTLWSVLLKYNPVSRVAVFGFMNPVFGVILSAWFLGEGEQASGVKSIVALILVCIGIIMVNYAQKSGSKER